MNGGSGTLILSWGNPGRRDDGLGPALTAALEEAPPPDVTVESDYQLQVECAADVAQYERVVFVDADRSGAEPFWMRRLDPGESQARFSTHSVAPETVLTLSRDLFDAEPEAWLLGIRGYEFDEFGHGLSERARANLDSAVRYVASACESGAFLAIDPRCDNLQDSEGEPCKTANS